MGHDTVSWKNSTGRSFPGLRSCAMAAIPLFAVCGLPPSKPVQGVEVERTSRITNERLVSLSRALRDDGASIRSRVERAVELLGEEIENPSAPAPGLGGSTVDSDYRLLQMVIDLINAGAAGLDEELERQLELRRDAPAGAYLSAVMVGRRESEEELFRILDLWNREFYSIRQGLRLSILRCLHYSRSPLCALVTRRALLIESELFAVRGEYLSSLVWQSLFEAVSAHGVRFNAMVKLANEVPLVDLTGALTSLGELAQADEVSSEIRRRAVATLIDMTWNQPVGVVQVLGAAEISEGQRESLNWHIRASRAVASHEATSAITLANELMGVADAATATQLTWLFEEISRERSIVFAPFLESMTERLRDRLAASEGNDERVLGWALRMARYHSGIAVDPSDELRLRDVGLIIGHPD